MENLLAVTGSEKVLVKFRKSIQLRGVVWVLRGSFVGI